MPNSQEFLPVWGCRMRDPGEVCGAPWEHPSTDQVIQIHSGPAGRGQPGISDLSSSVHQRSGPPVKAQGWMGSTSGGCDLQNFLLYCLDVFFVWLKPGPDYSAKHPSWAGQAGWLLGVPCCQ